MLANKNLTIFICDYCRLIIIGNARTHEVEALMDEEIQTLRHDKLKAYHAVTAVADGLPAIGIIAAVLGVVKAMGALAEPPEVLGGLIGAALVGTFAGIFFSYAVFAPHRDQDQGEPREADAALHHDQADAARLHERGHAAGRGRIRPQDDLGLRAADDRRGGAGDGGRRVSESRRQQKKARLTAKELAQISNPAPKHMIWNTLT